MNWDIDSQGAHPMGALGCGVKRLRRRRKTLLAQMSMQNDDNRNTASRLHLALNIAERYMQLPQVEAVALAGSQASDAADQDSDLDLYVYLRAEIPIEARATIATDRAKYAEVGNQFWEPGDEWIDAETGIHVDVMFRTVEWIEQQLDRVLRRHEAAMGYSTCFWYNVLSSHILYDREGWLQRLQQNAGSPYPEQLRRAIVVKNYPILRRSASSYRYQLERAVARNDLLKRERLLINKAGA
jgi:hypothetical protein